MKITTTWYRASELDKEAGLKEAVVAIAVSLILLPFDIAALHWAKRFNKSPAEIGESVTPEIKEIAWEVIERSESDPDAKQFVESVVNEVSAPVKTETTDLTKWANDIDIVAKTIYGEASGQGTNGMMAVASVIWNRANGSIGSLKKICLKPKQFSCWNDGVVNPDVTSGAWAESKKIAKSMFSGGFSPTTTADHYYAYQGKYKAKKTPYWAKGKKPVTTVKDQKFFDII